MASAREDTAKSATPTSEDTSIRDNSPPGDSSDGDGSEKTTRERLKKTSIAGLQQHSKASGGGAIGDHPLAESITIDQVDTPSENGNGNLRGRPSKKRSFEDLQKSEHLTENGGPPDPQRSYHKRMRSRDVDHGDNQEIGKLENIGSPVQEESDDDAHDAPGGPGVLVDADSQTDLNAQTTKDKKTEEKILEEEDTTNEPTIGTTAEPIATAGASLQSPDIKLDSAAEQTTLSTTSGFANASSASPFGNVNSSTKSASGPQVEERDAPITTSSSAFASSGLSAFASSEKSPFGASGTTKPSGGFGSGAGGGFGAPPKAGFGSGGGGFGSATGFGSRPSGFGGNTGFGPTGGFGGGQASKAFGAGISSFASGKGPSTFGKPKQFGVKSDDESEDGAGDDGEEKVGDDGDQKQDTRFHEQHGKRSEARGQVSANIVAVETGEEEENLAFSSRARLYHFEKEWKERGTGMIKLNVLKEEKSFGKDKDDSNEAEEEDPEAGTSTSIIKKGRIVMRADGVHRVILNTPVFKGMKVGTNEGKPPIGKTMYLTGMEDGQPRLFQVKVSLNCTTQSNTLTISQMGKEDNLVALYEAIEDLKAELE